MNEIRNILGAETFAEFFFNENLEMMLEALNVLNIL